MDMFIGRIDGAAEAPSVDSPFAQHDRQSIARVAYTSADAGAAHVVTVLVSDQAR